MAMSTAIGVFVGMTPTMPFHTIFILGLALMTGASTVFAILVSWIVCNPLTCIPIYYSSMVVGNFVTPGEPSFVRAYELLDSMAFSQDIFSFLGEIAKLGVETITVMVIGGVVQAVPLAVASYYLSLYLFKHLRQTKKRTAPV